MLNLHFLKNMVPLKSPRPLKKTQTLIAMSDRDPRTARSCPVRYRCPKTNTYTIFITGTLRSDAYTRVLSIHPSSFSQPQSHQRPCRPRSGTYSRAALRVQLRHARPAARALSPIAHQSSSPMFWQLLLRHLRQSLGSGSQLVPKH